jgi:hypothetical protein
MMPLIPYKHIRISTTRTVEKAVGLVSSAISPRRTLSNWSVSTGKEFEGSVNEQGFKIQKIIHNRNSFLPVLYGKFVPTDMGTKVDIHLTMDRVVIIFVCLWLAASGGAFLLLARGSMASGKWDNNTWSILVALVFFYLMIFFGYGFYAKTTEEFIMNLFGGYKIEKV